MVQPAGSPEGGSGGPVAGGANTLISSISGELRSPARLELISDP